MDTNFNRKLLILTAAVLLFLGGAALAAPQLSYEELSTVADDHVVITWVTSNETSNTGIEYGIGLPTAVYVTDEGTNNVTYHYLTLSNLYQNTTYYYRIFSKNASNQTTYGEYKTFTTLQKPSGQLLFTFTSMSDPQITMNYHDTTGARGRPYNSSEAILGEVVNGMLQFSPSFAVIKGDCIDDNTTDLANDVSRFTDKINTLKGGTQVFPIPGNHDKSNYTDKSGWYDLLLKPILNLTTYATPTGFSNYSFDDAINTGEDSVYNYSIDHRGYHLVFLDSERQRDAVSHQCKGHVSTAWLANDLAAARTRGVKSMIFMHNVITSEAQSIPEEVLKEVTGGTVDMEKIDLDNRSDFLTVLSTYESDIVGLFMGHIHDNYRYYRSGYSFPFVRNAAPIQFPVSYNVYKVYSNGYMQLAYKVPHYTELGRNQMTAEAGYSDVYWEQASLGSNYDRNFVVTYPEVQVPPAIGSNAPANGSTKVALDQPVIIHFTKQMSTDAQNAVTISPAVSGLGYTWSNSDMTLTIAHADLSPSTAYTVTVGTGARSKDNIPFAAASSFTFTSGTSVASTPPQAAIDKIANDISNDPTPTFTGIATDEFSTIASIEYRVGSAWSNWKPCTPLDGLFNSNQENFTFTVTPEIARGEHQVQIRCSNAAGITTTASFSAYSFYYVGSRPEIILKADGTEIINGDPIKTTPSFEVTVITDKALTLANLLFKLDGAAQTAASASQINNRTITYAFYNPTLAEGTHEVRVEATDDSGNISTREALSLLVQTSGDVKIFGVPLSYPNPFDPGSQTTNISYTLSRAANVNLRIFDIAGNQVAKRDCPANQTGGKAGYNEVTWDGRSDGGDYLGNGIYIYLVIVDGNVVSNGKGKLTVFKR